MVGTGRAASASGSWAGQLAGPGACCRPPSERSRSGSPSLPTCHPRRFSFSSKRRAVDLEEPSGFALAPAGQLERPADHAALEALELLVEVSALGTEVPGLGAALGDRGSSRARLPRPWRCSRSGPGDRWAGAHPAARSAAPRARGRCAARGRFPASRRPSAPRRSPRAARSPDGLRGTASWRRKCCAISGMSSRRSRSAGRWMRTTSRR